jgi:hypothetical protein
MIDNLLGSLDYTAKLPTDIKVNTELPKFRDLTPVNINNLLADNQKDDQLSFDDLLRRNEQKYGRTEELNKPYFINRYEYERYINSDKDNGSFFNWKPNPIFKNPLYFDNEELNAQQQSGLRQFINGTSKALPSMISSFVEGLNPIPGTKEGEFQKWIHDWSKQLEYTHPNYYSKQEKDNPFAISTILDGNFWGDKVLKNAGFTIGAIGGVLAWDAAISAATLGSGTAPATAIAIGKGISMISKRFSTAQKLINGVKEASMVGKAIKSSNLAYEGLKNYSLGQKALTYSKLGFLNYVGSNSEASIEGYEGLESLNDELISEFIKREGRKPEAFEYANIKDIARQMANTRYSINLPLLMITNAIEFGSLFSPSKLLTTGGIGFGERLATDAAGKIFKRGFKDFTVLEKLGYGVTNPLVKNFLAESFQEGTQYSIEKATRDLGFKKFQNPNFRVGLSEYMESQALGIKKTFSETEGLESMLIGGITGAITTGFTSSWDKFISKQSEKESKILDETINEYNTLTEEGILDSKYFKDYMTRVVERDQINFDGTLTHLTIEAQIQKAIEDKNVFAFKALQHDKLFNLVSLATRLDKLDAFKLKIEQLRGLSTEELAQNLGIQNLDEEQTKKLSGVIDEYVDLVQNKVEQMSDIIKVVNNSLINNFDPEKDELKFHAFNDLKNTFGFQLSNISDIKGRISEEMDNLLSDKMNPLSESLINTLLGQEESEQTLIIDDFTKNFVSEKGFDLSILDNKYAKPYIEQLNVLNSEISTLNLSIESAKAAKLPYEGYKSKLNQKKKQLADFVEFLSEFNNKIQTFSETLKNSQDFTEAANIDAFKDLTSHVIKYEMNKDLNNPISISKADEIVEAIADLHLLNSSLKLFIKDNNKFQTPKGQSEYLDEYIKWKSFAENKVQEAVRKANFETLKRQKPESINLAKSQISSNISEIEEINAQLQILNEQLIEAEDKEPIQKQIDELKAKKEELKKQNEELEKVADALENDKDLDESEKEEEDTIKADIERRRQEELTKIIQSIFPNTQLNEIVYHGTRTQDKFDTFDETKIGELDSGYFGRGFYFSPDKSYAEGYSKQYNGYTIAAILNLQNPLETDANKANTNISLEKNDGAIVRVGENLSPELNTTEYDANEIGEVVVKNSNQIHILSEKELNNIDKINAKYDAEYVDAVKNGEITKEQAKAALNQINRLTPELEKQIDNANIITVKKEENNSSEISTIETVIPTTGITIDIQSQNKLDAPLEQLEKQDFNGRLHFKRTTDVEKTDGTGRTERFQSLLESFITNNGVSQTQNLNNWLENNKLKFVIMRPTDEMFNNKTFREEFKDVNNELKSAVLVLVDENNKPIKIKDNKIDETGEFIVETLPTRQKKSTWSDQLQIVHDKEHKQLHDAVNKIKSSPDGVVIETKITAVADGVYRFMVTGEFGKVLKVASPLTKSTLNSANSELFINTTGENLKVGNFTLQKGRLYLKIFNEDKTLFYFPISLGAISGSKTGDNIYSVLEYVFKNHKTLKEESETKLIAIQNYLNSVLYDGVDLNLPGDVKFRAYTNLLGDEPIFEINREKDGKKYTLQYSLATPTFSKKILFDFLKGVDINSITLSKTDEFTLPKVEKDSLSIEKINYADFILEQTQPTIPYKIDLSKGFDRVKQAVYFDIQEQNELLSNAPKSTEQEQIIPERVQSNTETKKAEIERIEIPRYFTFNELGGGKGESGKALSSVEADKNNEIQENFKQQLQEGDKLIEPNGTVTYFRNGKVVKADGSMYGMVNIPAFINGVIIERSKTPVDTELSALEQKETPKVFQAQDVTVKKDEKSNWNLTVNSDGTVLNKNTNKLLDERLDKNLINKAHLKSGFLKYEKVTASNKKEYAVTEDGRVISLAKTSLGAELDVENSSIAKDALKKSTKFKVETPIVEEIKSDNPKIATDNSALVEEPTKEKKKFNKGNINIELKSAKRLPIIQSLGVTQTDIERVKGLFPHDVNIDNLFNVANSDAWATWSQSAITLFKGATRADLYHEAWHHFSQLYLTKDEKKRLYGETRDRVKELEGKSDLEVEEYIAREFAKFTETGKIEGKYPERKSIFEKIWNLLKSLFSGKSDLSLETLFNTLYKGQVNPLNYSTDNIMFGKLNSGINDNFSIIEADILNSGLDALVVQALQEFNISETQVYKLKDSNQLYEAIRNYIIDLYEQSENSIITSKLEKVLENWNDVKKVHLEYTAKKKGIKVNVEIDENNQLTFKEENEDEKKGRNSSDFSEASEKTIYDVMDTEVQSLIRNLVDKDEKGNEIIDPIFGLPRLVDFAKYVELLKDSFDDSQDFNQMVEKMNELSKKYPAIKDLVNRLFVNESPDVKLLRIKFVSSLGLVNKALVEAHITENGVIVARDASNSKKRQVEYDVTSYFFKAPENNLISKVDGENVIASDKVSEIEKYNLLDINEQVRFLQDIGLDVSNLYKELNEKDKKQLFNPNSLIYLRDHIIKYLSTKGDIKNIVEVLQTPLVVKEGSKASKEVKVFKKLVELNQKYLAQYISGAFLNPDGKLEQSKVQWSTQDKVITKLRKAKKIQDLFNDPNFTHLKGFLDGSYLDMSSSKLLDYLFDKKTGERKLSSLTTDNYVGISSSDETKDGMKTKAMYSKDKMISDINMFAQSNRLTTMQLSNKATHHTFQFNKPLVDSIDDFIDTMYIYLQDELNIIKSFDEGNRELTKLKKLPESIKNAQGEYQFAIFKDIIKGQDAQSVIADFLKDGKLSNTNTAKVKDAIKQFILEEKQATVEILGGFTNEIKTDVDRYRNASKELIIQDYIQNQFVFNVELSKLIYGNPYMHTDPYKRIAGASSAGRSILSDQTFLDYYNEMTTSTQRSKILDLLQSEVGGEYKLQTRKSDKEIRYIVVKDREVQSEYFKEILKAVDAELAKNPDNLELQEKRKAIENAYKEVNGSDAMGACTIDFWRKSLLLSSRWDFHTLEPFYQKVINWDYYNRLMKSAENPQQELEYFTEREKYNISDEEMVNVAILKYQYYGTVENESIAEKAFHKFQLMPLIPQVVEGKNWSNHVDRMIYEDGDYMMFESASKLEQDKQVDNFYTKDNKTADFTSQISNYQSGINSYNIKTGFLDNLKEQVFMENGSDDSILFGSQVRKLLFVTNDFSELYDEFRDTIQALTQIEKEKLMSLSGLDEQGRVTDNQKFVKFLLDEIDKKTVNKNVKEYLRLTNEGNFAHSLDTNIQRQPIESIINSVVNSRLVKQKMHGEMIVQVSNVGFESLEDAKGLKFYSLENGKVRKMQVKIPLTGKFKNLLNLVVDGQKVGTRERLNQLLKEGKIDTRSITMVGYRIPTQEHNSMEIMEVEEFLHPSLNGIVVPYEITAKAGSDFDIDKLNIFKPHINSRGEYIEESNEEEIKKLKEKDRKNIIRNYIQAIQNVKILQERKALTYKVNKDFVNYYYSIQEDSKNFKQGKQNKVIEIFDKVLLDPSNYLNLITPNSTFMFDGAMDNIFEALYPNDIQTKKGKKMPKDLNLTKSLLPRSSWQTKAILDEAGQALGIAAVGNTFTQLIQKANVEFTEDYLKKYKLLFEPESISKRTLSNGLSKATAYSQLINIYVDIANDPRAGYLNMGDRVTPIINTMINMGLAIDTILYFINQPIIRDFVEYEGMIKNSLFKGKEYEESIDYDTGEVIMIPKSILKSFIEHVTGTKQYFFGTKPKELKEKGAIDHTRFTERNKSYKDITDKLLKENVNYNFTNEELKKSLKRLPENINRDIKEDFSKKQLLLLSQYLQLSEISSDYRELQSSMNFDTTVAKDGFDSEQREKAFEEVIKKGIFTNLDVLKTKTVIAPLNISKELKNLNESLLPLVNSSTFYSFLSNKLESNFKNSTSKVKGRFVRTFKNDLISYIFQNFVTRSDVALTRFNETFSPVLGEFKNKPNEFGLSLLKNLYKEMIVLQENKPELADQYTILNNLFIVSEKQFKNIALSYFNKDSQLQDSYIEQFKELLNHKDLEVRNFMLKFAYMSFFQSGLNKSFISSADIIPAHIFAPILDAAREQYFKEVNTPQKQLNILKDAFDKFLENNDRFRAKEGNRGKSDFNTLGVKSDKGKWYVSNIDEVLNPTLSVLDKQKVDLTNAIEFEGYYILDNKVYNNQGIEVYNPDVLQDFKLEKIKPTEEQQKVIDRVKEFIKSPNKELLSPENVLMISGAGGTGKTFSITRAARQLQKEKYVSIAFSAPTHNAKRELQKSLNDVYGKNRENAHTNASLFALDYNPITGKTTKRIINESFPPEYWNKSVIILDEYSMLGGELWKMIQERLAEKQEKGYGHTKIIFTGDYAQIPVPDSSRKEFMDGDVTNWIYHARKDRVEGLYTNMRAKFADLANTSARIRTYIDRINDSVIYKTTQEKPEEIIKDFNNSFIKNKETSTNVKYYNANNKVQWLDSYIDAYKNLSNRNPYFGVIVNYNNSAHINNINLTKKIREELFGLKSSNRFNEGELLIIDNNTLNAGLGTLGKDMRVYVESITKTKRKQNFSYKAKGIKGEKYFSIEFDAYQITATTDGEDVLTFYVPIINETVLDKYKNQDFDFLNIQGEKPENINQLIAIIDPNIAQVSYGYVVNSHKVQGSSYDQVWVQEDNILTAREPKEVLQLLYTAYSRPKYKTHSLNKNSNIEIKEEFEPYKKESESTVQQSEVNTVEQNVSSKGFQGYKGGFEDKGKGTPQGDGKDKAMREVADGFIGEIKENRMNNSSSATSFKSFKIQYSDEVNTDKYDRRWRISFNKKDKQNVIMLARNAEYQNIPLLERTKELIKTAYENGAEFVVGDMPNVDSQFIEYLQEIGAKFTIYHTGNTPRIQVKQSETKDTQITKKETKTACEGGLNI